MNLLLAAAALTALLVTLGGVVCVTESGLGCPDWPGCYGRFYPPAHTDAIIEFSHRIVAALSSALILASAFIGLHRYRSIRWLSWPLATSIPLLGLVSFLGARTVLGGLSPAVAALDLGSALLVLTLVVVAATVTIMRQKEPDLPDQLSLKTPLARLALVCLLGVFLVLVSGVLVSESDSIVRCLGWPSDYLETIAAGGAETPAWPLLLRNITAGVVSILVGVFVVKVRRTSKVRPALNWIATGAGLALLTELLVGALMTVQGKQDLMLVAHVVAAVVFWVLSIVATVLTAMPPAAATDLSPEHQEST